MHRLACLFLVLILSVLPAFAAPRPPLPEKVSNGDAPAAYPAEAARRAEAAKVLIGQGDLDGASQELDKALAADPTQPMAYFYRAVVFYRRGDYEKALRDAALGRDELQEIIKNEGKYDGDDDQLQRFKELADAIQAKQESVKALGPQVDPAKKKQEFDENLRAGDEAYGKGLLAKAAAAYAKAFRADPTQGEIGLRAASLYADRLKNLLEAALFWQQVLAAGEPHATTARAELQSHRETLDALLHDGLARREQWRNSQDVSEPLRLAQAFPESAELQIELALLFARKGQTDDMINHLQSASRLGMSAEDFLGQSEFTDYFARASGLDAAASQPLVAFVRDAYGEEPLTAIRTELQRRADETVRLAREKAEKERQAKLAAERKDLTAWRDAQRLKAVEEVNRLISARNGVEVELAEIQPGKKRRFQSTVTRSNSLSFRNGQYLFTCWHRLYLVRLSSGVATPHVQEESISLPSLAPWRGMEVWPSSWEAQPVRIGDSGSVPYYLPADPNYRALCKNVRLNFNPPPHIRRQQTVTYEYETADGSTGRSYNSDSDPWVEIPTMLNDGEIARLKDLFQQLAKLDAAGNDVAKLRQLRQ